eukprot:6133684-Prymnesium_polylepis.4
MTHLLAHESARRQAACERFALCLVAHVCMRAVDSVRHPVQAKRGVLSQERRRRASRAAQVVQQ